MAWDVQPLVPSFERKEQVQQPVHRFISAWSCEDDIRCILQQCDIGIQKATAALLVFCRCRRSAQGRVVGKEALYIRGIADYGRS
ncbi:hypothetical protein C9412_16605 [Stenotrophomonas sp. Nf1]|nr:hypothetical protein C9412_16605 [Stenotrophomonas sp. Nf1]